MSRPLLALLATVLAWIPAPVRATGVYEREIAPILRSHCAGCHNAVEFEGDFSVETFAALRAGGDKGDPVRPGNADDSLLIKLLEGRARPAMPPDDEPRVPADEIARLRRWIADGAPGPERDVSILESLEVPHIPPAGGRPAPITAMALSPDGQLVAIGRTGGVELRSPRGSDPVRLLGPVPGKVQSVRFSSNGRLLAVASGTPGLNGVAQVWDVAGGRLVREFTGHRDLLYAAEFSPDGSRLATAGYDRVIRLWRMDDGAQERVIQVHNGAVFALAFHPSGMVLASASADQTVKLWRVADGTRIDTLNQPQGELSAVAFTSDGSQILAAGADRRIHRWNFVTGDTPGLNPVLDSRFAHDAPIVSLALASDGRKLVTAAADRSVKVWSLPELTEVRVHTDLPDVVTGMILEPGAAEVLVARLDGGTARLSLEPEPVRAPPRGSGETEAAPDVARAPSLELPATVHGRISRPGQADLYRFRARAGQELTLAIDAARSGSALDSRLEILDPAGRPLERVVLQAVRDSWFTFRGKDSSTSDDFRLQNWAEMELDEWLYAGGEVVRLWLYPRGPDSGFKVYPGEGARQPAFGTTALVHALNEPAYIVEPHPPGSNPVANGLPVFRLHWENDDDPYRRWGSDSLLLFTAPADGEYLARVTDIRGFASPTNHSYTLTVRDRQPGFDVATEGKGPAVSPGSGREVRFVARREEGFDGPIRIGIDGLPKGFSSTAPVEIEAGQIAAVAVVYAEADAPAPGPDDVARVRVTAHAEIQGTTVTRELGTLGELKLGPPARLTLEILPGDDRTGVSEVPGEPLEFSLRPGETLSARVRAYRRDFTDHIELGGDDSGRNLPHGLYVDNIGLNGLLIVEGQTEREFFLTAAPKARPGTRLFHLRARADGGQASRPVRIRVLPVDVNR